MQALPLAHGRDERSGHCEAWRHFDLAAEAMHDPDEVTPQRNRNNREIIVEHEIHPVLSLEHLIADKERRGAEYAALKANPSAAARAMLRNFAVMDSPC